MAKNNQSNGKKKKSSSKGQKSRRGKQKPAKSKVRQPTKSPVKVNKNGNNGLAIDASNATLEIRPEHFINRELSWLAFNARVLQEAEDSTNPLLERLKFLSIFSSNLDEFFMVRVAGLREQAFGDSAPQDYSPDGLTPGEQLERISQRTQELVKRQYRCWREMVKPALQEAGISFLTDEELSEDQRASLDTFFEQQAFPILTPMAVDPSHPNPRYHNRGLYLAALLKRKTGFGPKRTFAVVQVPQALPRAVELPSRDGKRQFIFLEDAVRAKLPELFGGYKIAASTVFRITRDSDIEVLEQEADDLLRMIEERLKARARGEAVRLEVSADGDDRLLKMLTNIQEIRTPHTDSSYDEVYRVDGPLDLTGLMELVGLSGLSELRDPPFSPHPLHIPAGENLFSIIRQRDILLHHPFDSFSPVIEFVNAAANDPQVLAIKQTLYRTGEESPITKALIQAAENKKQVTALVELKARFDEEANVEWARQMERAGVHVVFGFMSLKTHCKALMVVRREGKVLRRYAHLSTGNYNPGTARLYTDLGLFTANEAITADVSALFNLLTGYSQVYQWRSLVVAPENLHARTLELIEEQTQKARNGQSSWIFAKLNALVDHRVIEALYQASQAGVPIDLVVRGICGLRPGIPGLSETIHVRSIVDRFLEHSRIMVFGAGDDPHVYLSSADWMPRNFYRRVESMFPIQTPELKQRILKQIIPVYLRDNVKARLLQPDGTYSRLTAKGETPHRCQMELLGLTNKNSMASEADETTGLPFPASSILQDDDSPDPPPRKRSKSRNRD
ncbi:MAG: polyphosphate kinase 1 [Pirellulales bacterium]|nr:polyphosphate kinase 1 [Pirellulales bacterium]